MLLVVEDVSVAFRRYDGLVRQREIVALDGLSFGVKRGEVLALVGASGAGKSLLAHALFGILPGNARVSGRIILDGQDLVDANRGAFCGRRMGLVPQSLSHLDPLVRCGRQLAWAARRSGRRRTASEIAALLQRFGLEPAVAAAFPHQLSGGMARRLMLAMAAAGDPDLVVADEPTSGLDPDNALVVLRHLRSLADGGKAVLLITHDLTQILSFADQVAILQSGRLVDIEPASAFAGDGSALGSSYARALWQAMPQNAFIGGGQAHA